jgi:hypothetical protein
LSLGIAIQTNLPTHHSDQQADYHSDQHADYHSDHYDDRQIDHHQSQFLGNDEYFEAYKAWSHPPDPVYKEIVPSYKEVVPGYSNPEPEGVTPPSTIYYGDTLAPKGRGLLYDKQLLYQYPRPGWSGIDASLDAGPYSFLLLACFRTSKSYFKFFIKYD